MNCSAQAVIFSCCFFPVLVRDELVSIDVLRPLAIRLSITLMNEVRTDDYGLRASLDFRSVPEQQKLRNPD
jgi:hypothetical protein